MTTLSLLKNVDELDKVRIKNPLIPTQERLHPDIDWVNKELNEWSKQFPNYNQRIDEILNLFCGLSFNACPSKERLLTIRKAFENSFYIDSYLMSDRVNGSTDNTQQIVDQLVDTLKTGKCDQSFIPGKRLIESLKDLKLLVNQEQMDLMEAELEKGFRAHLDIHCNYWMKKRFISCEDYVTKRLPHSFWPFSFCLSEPSVDYQMPSSVRNNNLVKSLYAKLPELALALNDYTLAKMKIMRNDITSPIVCLLHQKRCSLQEAFDIRFEYIMDLYKQCIDLKDKINASPELRSDRLSTWMETAFNIAYSVFKTTAIPHGIQVNPDQTLKSGIWDEVYNDLVTKSESNVNLWDI